MKTIRVFPKSKIESWGSWPEDVQSILKAWNKLRLLTFTRQSYFGVPWRVIFQCESCDNWHEPPGNGVAVLADIALCDPCLISLARFIIKIAGSDDKAIQAMVDASK